MSSNTGAENHFSAELLAENLKALNAKERDHLMRLAYLGQNGPYEKAHRWLSEEMESELRKSAELPDGTRCIFAGMDYHLDWLYAALLLACKKPRRTVSEAVARAKTAKKTEARAQDRCDGFQERTGVGSASTEVTPQSDEDATLFPVSGRQEDIDLLVLFADGDESHLLFIEAKGVAAFNQKQLARKLIRLNRILARSGARELYPNLICKLLLAAPKSLSERSAIQMATEPTSPDTKLQKLQSRLREETPAKETPRGGYVGGEKRVGFVPLVAFPSPIFKVTRIPVPGEKKKYTYWKVAKR